MEKIQAVGSYVVVERKKGATRETSIGLEVPTDRNDRFVEASVISVSESATEALGIQDGDVVLYDRMAGHDVDLKGKTYRVIRATDVAVVL